MKYHVKNNNEANSRSFHICDTTYIVAVFGIHFI